jgi:hypothetical protein
VRRNIILFPLLKIRSVKMPVMERTKIALPPEALNLPEADYPEEVVERWVKMREITEARIATGELKTKTIAEVAAEHGIILNG